MRLLLITLISFLGFGCKPTPQISTYEVKSEAVEKVSEPAPAQKSAIAPASGMPASAAMQAETASFGSPKWPTTPAAWRVNAPNPMRKGSWSIAGSDGSKAEIAVTVFPGDVGGITANVNRWRGQLALSSASEAEVNATAENATVGNDAAKKFTLISTDQKRMTVALLVAKNNSTWFCKLSGDTTVVRSQIESFLKFFKNSQLP
jgi:hypothetical protein